MFNMFVMGNGFDIEHEIPSTYKNFLIFVRVFEELIDALKYDSSLRELKEREAFEKISSIPMKYIKLSPIAREDIFKEGTICNEFMISVNNNIWIAYFQKRMDENINVEHYNWVDIETEISHVIKTLTEDRNKAGFISLDEDDLLTVSFNRCIPIDIIYSLMNHIANRDYNKMLFRNKEKAKADWMLLYQRMQQDFANLIRALEIYLDYFIDKGKVEKKQAFEGLHFNRLITFNYTDTYRKLYSKDTIPCDFIHGRADANRIAEQNNMVLGIDEFLPEETKNKDIEFIEYRKYYQRIVKRCDFGYRRVLPNWDKVNVWFFGHSLATSDREILVHLLPKQSSENNVTAYIYYHSEHSFKQQVVNLVQILGQDLLNELVCGANPKIEFLNQKEFIIKAEKYLMRA